MKKSEAEAIIHDAINLATDHGSKEVEQGLAMLLVDVLTGRITGD